MTQNNAKFNTIGTDAYRDISGHLINDNATGSMIVIKIQHNDVMNELPYNGDKLTWIFGTNRWEPVPPAQFLIGPAAFYNRNSAAFNDTAYNTDTITTFIQNYDDFYVQAGWNGQIMIVQHTCPSFPANETLHTFNGSTINGIDYYTTPMTRHIPTILMTYDQGNAKMVEIGFFGS